MNTNKPNNSHAPIRFATFNTSLNRASAGELRTDLSSPDNAQAQAVAEIIQRTRPEVLLINEFDYDPQGESAKLLQDNYLSVAQNGAVSIEYPFVFLAPSNTGIPSGRDLDKDESIDGPDDAFGFGSFPGQFGMLVLSQHPIDYEHVRTFQHFLWQDMPEAMLPVDPVSGACWYDEDDLNIFRLSSKSHWDVPVKIGDETVHLLASHPTPPIFDGPENRHGKRNHDEIRFWADYISPSRSSYIYDDNGIRGGLQADALFVIAGDQNADPVDGDTVPGAIQQLLDHPLINSSLTPHSAGGVQQAVIQGGANKNHVGNPAFDTANFSDDGAGNLRVDYALPHKKLHIVDSGVFWPTTNEPLFRLVSTSPLASSDHRLVWIDLLLPFNRIDLQP